MTKALIWFRKDLRLEDNPALNRAVELGLEIIPVFIYAPHEERFKLGKHKLTIGAASKVWLHYALKKMPELVIRQGDSLEELEKLIEETQARYVFWNRRYEPFIIERDKKIKNKLAKYINIESFNGSTLVEPWEILNKQGSPYKVFTPYYKCIKNTILNKLSGKCVIKKSDLPSLIVEDLKLLPETSWHKPIVDFWSLDKLGWNMLEDFKVENYDLKRNRMDLTGTSMISPYLAWGQVSPRQLWCKYSKQKDSEPYLRQLIWREFSYYLMYHFPKSINEPLNVKFKNFPSDYSQKSLEKWRAAKTGFNIVDAAMKQLWKTGWMHNRARMIVASFLTKDLLVPWQDGAAWFWDTLVDADLANNTMGWQWVAGCGADAAPYYRIFNPETQAAKFDPYNLYQGTWLEEISEPIIDHKFARERALRLYQSQKVL